MLPICCVNLIGCQTSRAPIAVKGIDYDDWPGHGAGAICLSGPYAKAYAKYLNHK